MNILNEFVVEELYMKLLIVLAKYVDKRFTPQTPKDALPMPANKRNPLKKT